MTNQQIAEQNARRQRKQEENAWRDKELTPDQKLFKAIFGDSSPKDEGETCGKCQYWYDESRGYACLGDPNACMFN